jgi:hypothetical protein
MRRGRRFGEAQSCEITKPSCDPRGCKVSLWCPGYRVVAKGNPEIGFGGTWPTREKAEWFLRSYASADPRHKWTVREVTRGWVGDFRAPTEIGASHKANTRARAWTREQER